MAIKASNLEGKPLYACPRCATPVHMVSLTRERRFYFRHEVEDGEVPGQDEGELERAANSGDEV